MPCLLRRAAALLATFALLAVPARGVLACEMATTAEATVVDHHAGHDMSGPAATDHELPGEQPHPTCDHLVGCAPLALGNGTLDLSELWSSATPAVPFVAERAPSPSRALEPPPPKR